MFKNNSSCKNLAVIYSIYLLLIVPYVYANNGVVKGKVIDEKGNYIKGAEVFCEQGLSEPLLQTLTDTEGNFIFSGLIEGPIGIFATCEGKSWGGVHINLPVEEEVSGIEIVLFSPEKITGHTVFYDGKSKEKTIAGVEIERIAILDSDKVAIPFVKLVPFGYKRVISDETGFFTIDKIPQGKTISIKAVHHDFAVSTLENIASGRDIKINLSKGCVVSGSVYSTQDDKKVKVANADVIIKNSQPPFESVFVRTDNNGEFTIRLNPGVYFCKAETRQLLSVGWEVKQINNPLGEQLTIYVYPSATLTGTVFDAISGKPVSGAKVTIEQGGRKSLVLTTGSKGKFQGKVAYGQASIKFEAIPGYLMPQPSQIKVLVSKNEIELPGVWVKKMNSIKIKVADSDEKVKNNKIVIANLINPPQLGWHIGNTNNLFEINITTFPDNNGIVGYLEVPDENKGNLFNIGNESIERTNEVTVYELGKVRGYVRDMQGEPLKGLIFSCVFVDEQLQHEFILWKILSDSEGLIKWDLIVPNRKLIFRLSIDDKTPIWESTPIYFNEGEEKNLGEIRLNNVKRTDLSPPSEFLYENIVKQCPDDKKTDSVDKKPTILVFADGSELLITQEVLNNIKKIWGDTIQYGIVVDKEVNCENVDIPIYMSKQTPIATTYIINSNGKIEYEILGFPIFRKPQ